MPRPILHRLAPIALLPLALGGCVTQLSLPQRQALDMLVGRSEADLTGELGKPTAITPAPGRESIVLYAWRSTALQEDEFGAPDAPQLTLRRHADFVTQRCDTRFRVIGGTVAAWSVEGPDCKHAPYPYLGNLKRLALAADAPQGRDLAAPFLFSTRTGDSTVLSGSYQTQ